MFRFPLRFYTLYDRLFAVENGLDWARRCIQSTCIKASIELRMPALSPTMTEGTIVSWKRSEGQTIDASEVICEIQTDKAVVSLEVDDDAVLAKIIKNTDSPAIQIGEVIAILAEQDEDWKEVRKKYILQNDKTPPLESSTGSTTGIEIKMPAMSPTMSHGTIVKWNKQEGDLIEPGDSLCEIETDKAVVSMDIDDAGILAKILVKEGTTDVKIGTLIALTVEEGSDWRDVQIPSQSSEVKATPLSSAPEKPNQDSILKSRSGLGPATNLLISQYGIDVSQVKSTGPKGLLKSDILQFIAQNNLSPIVDSQKEESKEIPPKIPTPKKEFTSQNSYTDIPISSIRSIIARRLCESKMVSPHAYSTVACSIDPLLKLKRDFVAYGNLKVSLNDFIIKAVGTTLQYLPQMNLNINGSEAQVMSNVDISVAVATRTGLITPIVKNVPSLSVELIAHTVRDLALKARENKLTLDEFQGGTFTISNLGMFGISEFTAIINPPQAAILAVGAGSVKIDTETGQNYTSMNATLSYDRRFVDEHFAAEFMATLRRILERPEFMNLGLVDSSVVRNYQHQSTLDSNEKNPFVKKINNLNFQSKK